MKPVIAVVTGASISHAKYCCRGERTNIDVPDFCIYIQIESSWQPDQEKKQIIHDFFIIKTPCVQNKDIKGVDFTLRSYQI